jgi:serine/threonine protein kinase
VGNGGNTDEPGAVGAPPTGGATIECRAVHGMLEAGARRLTEQALHELAEHLVVCGACSGMFDSLYSSAPAGDRIARDLRSAPQPGRLVSQLVSEVLAQYERQHQSTALTLIHRQSPAGPSRAPLVDCDGQLSAGQSLQGRSNEFLVTESFGQGDFTETYAADCLGSAADGASRRARAVVKIPRIADEMSSDAATDRLLLLRSLIRVHAQDMQNLAGLREVAQMIDCGKYVHRLHGHSIESTFVAYEYVDGLDLPAYMTRYYSDGGQFRGLPTAAAFADWARMLAKGVLEIHNRSVLHGAICPRNVVVTPDGQPVFVDVGQALFREVMNGARAFSGNFYRAPEGISTPSSDLFSLGGLLLFVATGEDPIGFTYTDREVLKQQIALKVKETNPRLYQDDVGVADIIASCLRQDGRVQHASRLLDDIDKFWPEATPVSILEELQSLTDPATCLDAGDNSVYRSVAYSHIRSLRRILSEMGKGVFDASGSPSDIRSAAYALLRTLGAGDEFVTVSLPAFWFPENIGTNGRFLSMCRNAAARGASVKRVLLINEDLSDPHLQEIVAAQLNAAADLDTAVRANFAIRYLPMSPEKRRRLVASGKHFGLLVKGGDRVAMSPVYDTNEMLVTLRFRSGLQQVEGLREAFEAIWTDARPLVDLRLPTASLNLDVIERFG